MELKEIQDEYQKIAGLVGDRAYRIKIFEAEMQQAQEKMFELEQKALKLQQPQAPAEVTPLFPENHFPDKAP